MVVSDRLKEARTSLKLPLSAVSRETGIGLSSLSEFENSKREPSVSQLQSLARVYRRSLTFFVEEEALPREAVLWRERPSEKAEAIEHDFLELCQRYSDLERWCGDVISPELPDIQIQSGEFNFSRATEVARKVGKELGLGDRPSFSLHQVLEDKCGIKIFHRDIEPTGTAASVRSGRYGWAVLLNSRSSKARRNFDLAHELFHLLTWDVFGHNLGDQSHAASSEEEKYANAFASHLLMPTDEMRGMVEKRERNGTIFLADVVDIAHQFQVSVEAAAWRIHTLYRLDQTKTEQSIKRLREMRPKDQTLPRQQDESSALPQRYQDLALRALQQGQMSTVRFAEYLGITVQEAMQQSQEGGLDAEITLTAH